MALVVKDRVKQTTTTAGTGTITLSGSVSGFQTFSVIGDGNTTYYAIVDSISGDWEVGLGTYTASGTTLSRDTVLESSNSGSLVPFAAGTKDVFVTYPAEKAVMVDGSTVLIPNGGIVPNANTTGTSSNTGSTLVLRDSNGDFAARNVTANQVTGLASPTGNTDAVNKSYVDSLAASGVHFHTPVRVESPINLVATYNNGTAGVGATLTNAGTQTALVIDGVSVSVGNRVLVYQQTNQTQNGVYTVTNVGSGSTNWVLTRATDADTYGIAGPNTLSEGSTFFVQEGATGAGETYTCNTQGTITFGTTNITFVQISSAQVYSANTATGITLTGTQFAISTVPAANGGTGQSSYTTGDLLYASGSTALSKLAGVATGNVLLSGGIATAPAWGKVGLATHVSGTLEIGNGGTGITGTPTNGQLLIGNGTGYTLAGITAGTAISVTNGAGSISIANAGVTNAVAGTGISVSASTGSVTFTNTDLGSSQDIFKNIAVSGQSTIVADSNNDTLTLVAASGTSITTDASTDTITFTNTGVTSIGGTTNQITASASTGAVTLSLPSTINVNTTGNADNVTGIVAVANGGTGANTDSGARTNLGATTIGSNLFTLTNPSAITFPRFNADNTVSSLSAADFRTAIGASTGSGDVVGPASATDNAIARFDLTTGKLIQNSSVTIDDFGNIFAAAGTALAPAFSTTGDTDTGIYFPSGDSVAISAGGGQRFVVDASGNIGVAISSPSLYGKFAIQGLAGGSFVVRQVGSGTTGSPTETPLIALGGFSSGAFAGVFALNSFATNNANWLTFKTGDAATGTPTVRVVVDPDGKVGINVNTPGVALDVGGAIRSSSATIANAGTITPTAGTTNQYTVTALAQAATIAAPSGTPIDGQKLTIRLKDDGTARALTWTTSSGAYRAIGVTLPTTTVASKVTYVGCVYNSQDTFWDVVAVTTQA